MIEQGEAHTMTAATETTEPDWLTREQIDWVLDRLTASDVLVAQGGDLKESQMAGAAFDNAAKRLGLSNGSPATEHMRIRDFKYFADRFGEVVNVESPLSEGQGA